MVYQEYSGEDFVTIVLYELNQWSKQQTFLYKLRYIFSHLLQPCGVKVYRVESLRSPLVVFLDTIEQH